MHMRTKQKMAGLTMIEVLVTLIILSVGLLGMAGLQITGVRSANNSSYRTQATLLANDMAERMRANSAAVDNNVFMAVNSANIDCTAKPDPYCSDHSISSVVTAAQTCTTAEMAAYDISVWFCGEYSNGVRRNGVDNILPEAAATITCVDTNPPAGADADACTDRSPHVVTVSWTELNTERGNTANPTFTKSVSVTMQPE